VVSQLIGLRNPRVVGELSKLKESKESSQA
jgi:hypothetical protein